MYRTAKVAVTSNPGLIAVGIALFVAFWCLLLPQPSADGISKGILVWWSVLCAVSVFNIGVWRLSAAALARRKAAADPEIYVFQRWQLLLSAVFVFGCAFRSILPRADVQRIGLFDSWVSS